MTGWAMRLIGGGALALMCVVAPARANGVGDVAALLKSGQHEAALASAEEQLRKTPNDPQLRFLQGLALTNLGRRNDALGVFNSLTRDYPKLAEPHNNIAVIHAGTGRYDEALAALNKAIQIDPNYATAYENLADLHLQMAQQALGKLVQLAPGNQAARQRQAQVRKLVEGPAASAAAAPAAPVVAAPERPAARPASDGEAAVAAVRSWAAAWSARDVTAYLGFYAPDFRTPRKESRTDWEAKRRALIESKSKIAVGVEAPQVEVANGIATVRFRQNYSSDNFTSNERKTLVLRKYDDAWKIVEERTGA